MIYIQFKLVKLKPIKPGIDKVTHYMPPIMSSNNGFLYFITSQMVAFSIPLSVCSTAKSIMQLNLQNFFWEANFRPFSITTYLILKKVQNLFLAILDRHVVLI